MIELRHFRYFIVLAETLHFGRAADLLHMSQPPLSVQIRQLEEIVGAPLLERNRRSVRLTAAGAVFLDEARRAVRQAELAVERARDAAMGHRGTLRIGFVSSAPFNVLPPVLRVYRERHPHVTVDLHSVGSAEQMRRVAAAELDLGLVRLPAAATGVEIEVILREPLVAVLPESHPLAGRKRITIERLVDDAFVTFPRRLGPGLYDRIMRFCAEAGFSPRVTQEVEQMHAIVGLVGAGLGVALVPASMRLMAAGDVVFASIARAPMVEMGLAWRADDPSPLVASFLAVARAHRPRRNAPP
jgi:DNA-binding transcriptional LysR family regulator